MIRSVSIKPIALIVLLACTGCSQVAYDSLRQSQAMNCQQMQGAADRDACMRRSDVSYDEYQRQLNKQKRQER